MFEDEPRSESEGMPEESIGAGESAETGMSEQEVSAGEPSEGELLREELEQVKAQNRELLALLRQIQEGAGEDGEESGPVEISDFLEVPSKEEEEFPGQAALFKAFNEALKAVATHVDKRVSSVEEAIRAPEKATNEALEYLQRQAQILSTDRNVEVARLARRLVKGDEELESALVDIVKGRGNSGLQWTLREVLLEYLSFGSRKGNLAPSGRKTKSAVRSTKKTPPPQTWEEAIQRAKAALEAKLGET